MIEIMMDITVIVPCFNSEETLGRCLKSLVSQTHPVLIYIINDGSTDSTLDIANGFSEKYKNIKIYSQDNCGLPQARKMGALQVKTKYTAFVDSDDWVDQKMMDVLYQNAEKYQAQISVCGFYYEKNGKTVKAKQNVREEKCVDGMAAMRMIHSRRDVFPFMCNKLFLTSIAQNLPYPDGNFIGEDYLTLCPKLESIERVAITDKALYHYVIKMGSMSKNGYGSTHRASFENYMSAYNGYINNHTKQQCEETAAYLCVEYAAIYVAMIRNNNYDQKVISKIRTFLNDHLHALFKTDTEFYYKISVLMIAKTPKCFNVLYSMFLIIQNLIIQPKKYNYSNFAF